MMWWGSNGWLWMLVSWAVIIGLVVWVVWAFSGRDTTRGRDRTPSARRILDERFARGEIDEEEYRRRRDELER
jgi:putative membrane protein